MESTLTTKGQMTLPKAARDHLRVKPGDRVKIFALPDGTVLLLPKRPISSLYGMLKYDGPPVTIEKMNEGIAAGAAASLGITPRPNLAFRQTRRKRPRRK